jgi:hypothetical protein
MAVNFSSVMIVSGELSIFGVIGAVGSIAISAALSTSSGGADGGAACAAARRRFPLEVDLSPDDIERNLPEISTQSG